MTLFRSALPVIGVRPTPWRGELERRGLTPFIAVPAGLSGWHCSQVNAKTRGDVGRFSSGRPSVSVPQSG